MVGRLIHSSRVPRLNSARMPPNCAEDSVRISGRIGSGVSTVATGATSASLQRYRPRSEMKYATLPMDTMLLGAMVPTSAVTPWGATVMSSCPNPVRREMPRR